MDALSKLVTDGVHCGAEALNQMLGAEIRVALPAIELFDPDAGVVQISESTFENLTIVEMGFDGRLKGNSGLVFEEENAWRLIEKFAGDDAGSNGFDFVSTGVLTEIGNIVLNRVLGAISNALCLSLDYVVPCFYQGDPSRLWRSKGADGEGRMPGLLARARFEMADVSVNGNIVLFFDEMSFETLKAAVDIE